MKDIIVLPRWKFEDEWKSYDFQNTAFISIRDFGYPIIINDCANVLNLQFDDAETQESYVTKLFDEQMADLVQTFIENNKDKHTFVCHCLMGQSRSRAIGEYINDYFGYSHLKFSRKYPTHPNSLVRSLLMKKLYL